MRVTRVNHLGVLVRDLPGTLEGLAQLGLSVEKVERIREEVDVIFLPCGDTQVELLHPLTPQAWGNEYLDRHGPGIEHVAFEVEDIEEALAELAERGVRPTHEAPMHGAANTLIAFLDPERFGGVTVELVQQLG